MHRILSTEIAVLNRLQKNLRHVVRHDSADEQPDLMQQLNFIQKFEQLDSKVLKVQEEVKKSMLVMGNRHIEMKKINLSLMQVNFGKTPGQKTFSPWAPAQIRFKTGIRVCGVVRPKESSADEKLEHDRSSDKEKLNSLNVKANLTKCTQFGRAPDISR